MTTIRYFIPEDGDIETQPNVFLCAKSRNQAPPTLGQIKQAFPLPGQYHFRFKCPLVPGADREKGAMAVWMDCVKDSEPAAMWRQTIVAKVTRTSMDDEDDDEDDDEFIARHRAGASSSGGPSPPVAHTPAPKMRRSPPPPTPAAAEPLLDVFDGGPTHSAPPSAPTSMPSSTQSSTGNLLDVPPPAAHHVPSAPTSGGSLLDMDAPAAYGGGGAAQTAHNDFLGMTASAPPATPAQHPHHRQPMPVATPQQQQHNPYPQQGVAPTPQQMQQQQRPPAANNGAAFNQFSNDKGPFGGLNWG